MDSICCLNCGCETKKLSDDGADVECIICGACEDRDGFMYYGAGAVAFKQTVKEKGRIKPNCAE